MANKRKLFRFIAAVMTVLPLLFCCSCSSDNADSQAYAYLEVFIRLVGEFEDDRIEYIGVDATKIIHQNPSAIRKVFEEYADKYGVSIRWNIKKNKCDYDFFSKGRLIIFEDIELTETKLETEVTWMGAVALFSTNITYVAEKEDGEWTVTSSRRNWIS